MLKRTRNGDSQEYTRGVKLSSFIASAIGVKQVVKLTIVLISEIDTERLSFYRFFFLNRRYIETIYKRTMRFNKSATYERYEYNSRKRKAQFLEDKKEKKKEKEKRKSKKYSDRENRQLSLKAISHILSINL